MAWKYIYEASIIYQPGMWLTLPEFLLHRCLEPRDKCGLPHWKRMAWNVDSFMRFVTLAIHRFARHTQWRGRGEIFIAALPEPLGLEGLPEPGCIIAMDVRLADDYRNVTLIASPVPLPWLGEPMKLEQEPSDNRTFGPGDDIPVPDTL